MKKNVTETLKRADKFNVILIGEGILVGALAGLIVLMYRVALEYADKWLRIALEYAAKGFVNMAVWFLLLIVMSLIVGRLVSYEPLISGSGIPQVEGEVIGLVNQSWWRIITAKFLGGFLCILGGLALGREGPSIQLGAMAGKGFSKSLKRGKTEERFLITCGAGAGLAAAFHAPLAGVMFSLEEIHKNFSASAIVSVMTASLTADLLCSMTLGTEAVFEFHIVHALPTGYYWMIAALGIILGLLGAFYNWFTLKVQELYNKAKFLSNTTKVMIPFLCAGILGFTFPQLLGSGHALIEYLTTADVALGTAVLILAGRFLFSAVSFGSGAPGGIFFPLLVLGGFIGGVFAIIGTSFFGLDPTYVNNFVLLAMAGYFAAIVRAPLTGIILIFEMTGSLNQMLSLSVVSIVAYIVADLLKSRPIYSSLLERLMQKQGRDASVLGGDDRMKQKVLMNFVVKHGSCPDGSFIKDISWPDKCLMVSVQRGEEELIPRGRTRLVAGDIIVIMADEYDSPALHEKMEELCRGF